jgi:preprotein translocase subunit SecE
MLRSAVSKVVWVGRATVFLVGLAVILAVVLGVATAAFGANGDFFKLGKKNTASAVS